MRNPEKSINFYIRYEVWVEVFFFPSPYGLLFVLALVATKTVLLPLNYPGTFVEDQIN